MAGPDRALVFVATSADSPEDVVDRLSEAHGQGQEQALADVARWLGCGPTVGEVEARCKELRPVEYRPGLPSAEQVRAHEARGGVWQVLVAEGWVVIHGLRAFAGGVAAFSERKQAWLIEEPARWLNVKTRPCLADGTPCPWPECP